MVTDFPRLRNVMWLKNNNGNYEPLCDFTDFTDVTTIIDAEEKPKTSYFNDGPLIASWNAPIMTFKGLIRTRITKADKRRLLGWRVCIPTRNTRRRQIFRALRMQCGPLPK